MATTTHIFIVDNNKLFVSLLGYIFTKSQRFSFTGFESGEECLRSLNTKPSLILLDYSLPGMNGYDTLLELRELDPSAHVIAILSTADPKQPADLLRAGANDCVLKDESDFLKTVISKVETYLSGQKTLGRIRHKLPAKKIYYYLIIL